MCKSAFPVIVLIALLAGCSEPATPDTNTHVFKTVDEVAAERKAAQQKNWKQSAIDILKDERPDITAMPENDLTISLFADSLRHRVDLSEVSSALTAQPDKTYNILREYLGKKLIPFDQDRLSRASFDSVRKRIRPMLLNGPDLQDLTINLGSQPPTRTIVGDLYWIPVVRWDAPRPPTPIGPKVIQAWKTAIDEVNKLALSNLANDPVEGTFEVTSFGTLGKVGTLHEKVDPAIILSPSFLSAARQALQTSDDLALLPATVEDVRFLPASDKRLLDSIYPNWKSITTNNSKALAKQPLLLSDAGIGVLNYAPPVMLIRPTSMPTTNPMQQFLQRRPTSRPTKPAAKPYIVR